MTPYLQQKPGAPRSQNIENRDSQGVRGDSRQFLHYPSRIAKCVKDQVLPMILPHAISEMPCKHANISFSFLPNLVAQDIRHWKGEGDHVEPPRGVPICVSLEMLLLGPQPTQQNDHRLRSDCGAIETSGLSMITGVWEVPAVGDFLRGRRRRSRKARGNDSDGRCPG